MVLHTQGALVAAGCLHATGDKELQEAADKTQTFHAIFCFFLLNFVPQQILKPLFVSLCEINFIKIQTMTLVLSLFQQRFFVFHLLYVIIGWQLKKKLKLVELLFSHTIEVKICGLVQQLILCMLRDFILQQHNFQLLHGELPLEPTQTSMIRVFYERLLSFIDFQLGYKYTSEKMEIFKMNLRLGKTS